MIDELFKFPIVMVDGEAEYQKEEMAKAMAMDPAEKEVFLGEAEVPYYDFIGIIDKWGYDEESKAKARDGDFDHCLVMFHNCGVFLVPWNKKKFKEELVKFANSVPPRQVIEIPLDTLNTKPKRKKKNAGDDKQGS